MTQSGALTQVIRGHHLCWSDGLTRPDSSLHWSYLGQVERGQRTSRCTTSSSSPRCSVWILASSSTVPRSLKRRRSAASDQTGHASDEANESSAAAHNCGFHSVAGSRATGGEVNVSWLRDAGLIWPRMPPLPSGELSLQAPGAALSGSPPTYPRRSRPAAPSAPSSPTRRWTRPRSTRRHGRHARPPVLQSRGHAAPGRWRHHPPSATSPSATGTYTTRRDVTYPHWP
jgi:hypothetical protein